MPPRKKSKAVVAAPSTPTAGEDTTKLSSKAEAEEEKYDPLQDPWTDEQETSLYKAIVKWKPAGMHKHFRMIAISDQLRNHGYDPRVEIHTRIPGIWEKLAREYNLPAIDEREKPHPLEENLGEKYREFQLTGPDNKRRNPEFEDLMVERAQRLPPNASSPSPQISRSPSVQSTRKRKRGDIVSRKRGSTVDDTDEPRTSPPTSSPAKATRSGRSANRAASRAKAESRSREPSKEDAMDVDEEANAEEHEDVDEEEATSSPKITRGRVQRSQMNPRKSTRKR